MAYLIPDKVYTLNGVKINEKIIPDSAIWEDFDKCVTAGFVDVDERDVFDKGVAYKANVKLSNGTGKVQGVTIHNTGRGAFKGKYSNESTGGVAEVYTRATYPNQNMNSARVHFYVDEYSAWQNLKAGIGATENDPIGYGEVGWHAGDGTKGVGNNTTISMELVMDDTNGEYNAKVEDNAARIAAYILVANDLDIDKLYTHTYFINRSKNYIFDNVDEQNTYRYPKARKYCPIYVLPHWDEFKALVARYMVELGATVKEEPSITVDRFIELDEVKIKSDVTTYYNGKTIPTWVKNSILYVRKVNDDGSVVISVYKTGDTTGTVWASDLELVTPVFGVMDVVRIRSGVTTYSNGRTMASWVPTATLYVRVIHDDGTITVSTLKEGATTGTVFAKDLVLVERAVVEEEPVVEDEPLVEQDGLVSNTTSPDIESEIETEPEPEPEPEVDIEAEKGDEEEKVNTFSIIDLIMKLLNAIIKLFKGIKK